MSKQDFPKHLEIDMVENGYIVSHTVSDGGYPKKRERVFTNAPQLAQWIRENAPSYGEAGNEPPILPEPGK